MAEKEREVSANEFRPSPWISFLVGSLSALIGLAFIQYLEIDGFWNRKGLLAAAVLVAACVFSCAYRAVRKRGRHDA